MNSASDYGYTILAISIAAMIAIEAKALIFDK